MWILAFICDPFQGCGILSSTVVQGMVFKRLVEGDVTKSENCKVAVYSCPLDIMQTETKVRREQIAQSQEHWFQYLHWQPEDIY